MLTSSLLNQDFSSLQFTTADSFCSTADYCSFLLNVMTSLLTLSLLNLDIFQSAMLTSSLLLAASSNR
ncbi:hypothetical protein F511_38622 [Dorcoceras hygrometricum]|uniref:Uncharacterized protein n=1 Tax=Dorcoceras hygrometricum TaxID=472368 RepID=A0A2Z7AYX6_9LAMI|nr:hypothetical protein F511_38622 [Dorcoceras hygrometricum]